MLNKTRYQPPPVAFMRLRQLWSMFDGYMLNLDVMLIGPMIQFAPIWIMQYVFCRQAEPELTYAPAQSLAQSSMVRFW